jgi:uncharacterized phage-associated protein
MALKLKVGFNRAKFKTLVQYVCWKTQDNPARLGATKLNKILWYSETAHYLKTGNPLTGARYLKRQHGPVPAAIVPIVNELVAENKLYVRDVPFYEFPEKREYITLEEPGDIDSLFSAKDIADIDRIIDSVCDAHTARSISKKTHNESWHLAKIGEDLPLFTVLCTPAEITEEDLKWADEKIAGLRK